MRNGSCVPMAFQRGRTVSLTKGALDEAMAVFDHHDSNGCSVQAELIDDGEAAW